MTGTWIVVTVRTGCAGPARASTSAPGARPSQQARLRERDVAARAHHHVVVHRQVEDAPRLDELARGGAVVRGGGGIAGGVVVDHDHPGGRLGDGAAEHLAGMYQ